MIGFLLNLPSSVKVFACFALILWLVRLKISLWAGLFVSSFLLGLWHGLAPSRLLSAAVPVASRSTTISLALILLLILTLGRLLEESGKMKRMVAAAEAWIGSRRLLAVFFPALVGFLPLPGGALFSAPMVETVCPGDELAPDHKTIVNYWFRHLWEYWWPFYPGFVLAVGLLGVEFWRFAVIQFPLALISLGAGWLVLIRPMREPGPAPPYRRPPRAFSGFLREAVPILVLPLLAAAVALVLRLFFTGAGAAASEAALVLSLAACLFMVASSEGFGWRRFLGLISLKKQGRMVLLVFSVLYFKEIIEITAAAPAIGGELLSAGFPVMILVAAIPFLAGLVSGIGLGFVGISFPVVLPLLGDWGSWPGLVYPSIAFLAGYLGVMLSPLHFCFLFSRTYFRAELSACYVWLIKLASVSALLAALYYLGLLAWLS